MMAVGMMAVRAFIIYVRPLLEYIVPRFGPLILNKILT